jgi:hypothetical protein
MVHRIVTRTIRIHNTRNPLKSLLFVLLLLLTARRRLPLWNTSLRVVASTTNHNNSEQSCTNVDVNNNNGDSDDTNTNNFACINCNNEKAETTNIDIVDGVEDVDDDDDDDDRTTPIAVSSYKKNSIKVLKERKAHLCWHKHSTFLDHLISVHDILLRWMSSGTYTPNDFVTSPNNDNNNSESSNVDTIEHHETIIPRIGIFHSAYSNSYVNLALFNVTTERHVVQQLIGRHAEEYVYIFCNINRQEVVVNTLLHQNYIPPDGLRVPHLRNTNETIYLSSKTLYILLIFTMADIADQYFDWQDLLFGGGNTDGSMILPGYDIYVERHNTKALWPGLSKPGLWMSYVSQLGQVARTYHNSSTDTTKTTTTKYINTTTLDIPILPPVFDSGTKIIQPNNELEARELYWSVISGAISDELEIIATLQTCMEKNPFIFEPIVLLSQVYAHQNDYTNTIFYATRAMDLQQQWGIAWDKRMSFAAWVAWTKVLLQRAQQQLPWPTNAWDVNNLGYVY